MERTVLRILGKKGRTTIPWPIRAELDFCPGDVLLFESDPPATSKTRDARPSRRGMNGSEMSTDWTRSCAADLSRFARTPERRYTPDASITEPIEAPTILSVPEAFADLYVSLLTSKIDYANGEIDRYNNDLQLYNYYKQSFESWFVSTHKSNITAKFNAL